MWKSHSDSGNARFSGIIARIKSLFTGRGIVAEEGQPLVEESRRARGLDCNQFAKVEVGEGAGIYVQKVSDSRYFDESPEYAPVIRPVYTESLDDFEIPEQPAGDRVSFSEPADIFSNARKRPTYEPINFNEIKIKQSVPAAETVAEESVPEAPTGLMEREVPVVEETPAPVAPAAEMEFIAPAEEVPAEVPASAEEPADIGTDDLMAELAMAEYSALSFYEAVSKVRESEARAEAAKETAARMAEAEASAAAVEKAVRTVQEEKAEELPAPVLALPQGTPVSMIGAPETAVADTVVVKSEEAPVVQMTLPKSRFSVEELEREAAELDDANCVPGTCTRQTVETSEVAEAVGTAVPVEYVEPNLRSDVIEVVDVNRDVLYAYRPALANDEEMFLALSRDDDGDLPEDGLESYDRKFKLRVSDLDRYAYHFSGNLRQLW